MRCGITFFLQEGGNIWNSGAVQHCIFLRECLQAIPGVEVVVINAGHDISVPPGLMLDGLGIEFVKLPDVISTLDVLIQCHGQVSASDVATVKANGGHAVAFKFGNEYVIDAERMMRCGKSGAIVNGAQFDEIWTNAQHIETCGSYWEAVYRCPVRVLPHTWSPLFIDKLIAAEGLDFGYKPGRAAKRIAIYEPNINIVKMAFLPLLVCELAFRAQGELIEQVLATNTKHMMAQVTFKHLCLSLDMVKAKAADGHPVCTFQGRSRFASHQAKHADVVVSHQWQNGLNFAYYDALHGGYPLIHNSTFLPDGIGYRYGGFDAHEGARVLLAALRNHDKDADGYRSRSEAFLETLHPRHPDITASHARALERLTRGTVGTTKGRVRLQAPLRNKLGVGPADAADMGAV